MTRLIVQINVSFLLCMCFEDDIFQALVEFLSITQCGEEHILMIVLRCHARSPELPLLAKASWSSRQVIHLRSGGT